MLFDFEQSDSLMTPIITLGGVNDINPILTSSNISSLDDQDVCFSSTPSKNPVNPSKLKENPIESHQSDDLYSTFEFPVLSELSRTGKKLTAFNLLHHFVFCAEFQLDDSTFGRYTSQISLPSPAMDTQDLTFYSVEDESTSSTFLWVGEECTIGSNDMLVPPSPPLSSASSPASESNKEISRKKGFTSLERKLRKKDQNKSAAEKYRLKKRNERSELLARHTDVKNQNQELKFEINNLTFQLEQFKQLFVDILQIPLPPSPTVIK